MQAIIKGTGADKVVSAIAISALVLSSFVVTVPVPASATSGAFTAPACGQTDTFITEGDVNSFFNVNFENNDNQIDVSADSSYTITKVEVDFYFDMQGDGNSDDDALNWIQVATGSVNNHNPSSGTVINAVRVTVQADPCPVSVEICHATGSGWVELVVDESAVNGVGGGDHNSNGHQSGNDIIPPGSWDADGRNWDAEGQAIYNNDCVEPPPPPVDACPNEQTDPGVQTSGPCNADDVCLNDGGIQTSSEDCTPEEPEVCPEGQVGTPPNCTTPEVEECPEGQIGEYPNCEDPASTPQEECEEAGNTWIDGACLTPEQVCLLTPGAIWYDNECFPNEDLLCEILGGAGPPIPDFCEENMPPPPTDACPNEETDPGIQESGPCNEENPQGEDTEDVCPNDEGVQTSTEECTPEEETPEEDSPESNVDNGGDGGTPQDACNERYGKERDAEGNCVDMQSESSGEVLGAADCVEYLKSYIRFGAQNDPAEVMKLQIFLNQFEGAELAPSGIYDDATYAAVHAFQKKFIELVLAPWGANESTGFVYLTTKKAINEAYCKFTKEFPLSADQEAEIARIKAQGSW